MKNSFSDTASLVVVILFLIAAVSFIVSAAVHDEKVYECTCNIYDTKSEVSSSRVIQTDKIDGMYTSEGVVMELKNCKEVK